MNSTKLHSLSLSCGTQAGENDSRKLWFATLESKETNKGRGKTRRGLLRGRPADRESNVEHMQAAASSNERGKTGEDSGAWQQREKRKRKGNGSWAGRFELGSAELNAKTNGVSAN